MPWSGELGDDADDDHPSPPPLPPEDRLWRHPSEVAWTRPESVMPVVVGASGPRLWAVALTSGLTGAVLALGVVAVVVGFGDGVRERVVERVPLVQDASTPTVRAVPGPARVAATVSPSIVRIDVIGDEGESSGSGVIFRDDGTVLTNAHVVDGASELTVVRADGTGFAAHVVGSDELSDIAVVAVDDPDGADWQPAVLGSADDLVVGEAAIAIGSPLGLDGPPSVTVGIISAIGRRVTSGDGDVLHDMIQTDAPIARGSSGGALCDGDGVVVGLTTALAPDGGDLGFATPIEVAKEIAEELLDGGAVHNPWLGIEGADMAPTSMSVPGVEDLGGAAVHAVTPGGPAEAAGLRAGDVVVSLDDVRIHSMAELVVALRDHEPGDRIVLRVQRADGIVDLPVTLAERTS